MIGVEELNEAKRLIQAGYIAEIYLTKEGKPQPWGGLYHLTDWDRRKVSRELFLAMAEDFPVEKRDGYLRIQRR